MLRRIDDAILASVAAFVVLLHARFGMDRHATIREMLTFSLVCSLSGAAVAATALPVLFIPLVFAILLMERGFPARWKEADRRSKASGTFEGWRRDMDLAAIHMRIREESGSWFLKIDLMLAGFYAGNAVVMAALGSTEMACFAFVFLLRSLVETTCRYAMMVPPPPPGSGGRERTPASAVANAA